MNKTVHTKKDTFNTAAYGGEGWVQRKRSHSEELGDIWMACGINNEWGILKSVLLHRPGSELTISADNPNTVQMLASLDIGRAQEEHDQMAERYRDDDVVVNLLDPDGEPTPNQMFCADLFAMTPQGAVLARPASTVRAGEEKIVARRLADMGVPILKTLVGHATFEGADLIWINKERALLGQGLRTNGAAAQQISVLLGELGIVLIPVDMPIGTMHLMGMLRIVDKDLAIAWPRSTPHTAVVALKEAGYSVIFIPHNDEVEHNRAFNFVTLGPRKILMADQNPSTQAFYESNGIECITTPATELGKAAGAIGCLTGILSRSLAD